MSVTLRLHGHINGEDIDRRCLLTSWADEIHLNIDSSWLTISLWPDDEPRLGYLSPGTKVTLENGECVKIVSGTSVIGEP